MMTERGKIILELVKSINAGAADGYSYNLVVEKAVNEYNELVKRNIIEPPYEHSNNIEEYKYKYHINLGKTMDWEYIADHPEDNPFIGKEK